MFFYFYLYLFITTKHLPITLGMVRRSHSYSNVQLIAQPVDQGIVEFLSLVVDDHVTGTETKNQVHEETMDTSGRLVGDGLDLGPLRQIFGSYCYILVARTSFNKGADEVYPPTMKDIPNGDGVQGRRGSFVGGIGFLALWTTPNKCPNVLSHLRPPEALTDLCTGKETK